MKQVLSLFSSMKTMVLLMLIFAFSIGYATIIENDYGTTTAKADIYNARWFEILLATLALNLIFNIFKFKIYKLKKAPIFIFHIAFLIILIGAGVTRYMGFEGSMHIREGQTSSSLVSADTYFNVDVKDGSKVKSTSQSSFLSKRWTNHLSTTIDISGKEVSVELVKYIPDAIKSLVATKEGKAYINLMVSGAGRGQRITLSDGESYDNGAFILDFNSGKTFQKPTIKIYIKNNKLYFNHDMQLDYLKMDDGSKGVLNKKDGEAFATRTLFQLEGMNFVLRKFFLHAKREVVTDPKAKPMMPGVNALRFKVSVGNKSKELFFYAQPKQLAKKHHIVVDGVDVAVSYGAEEIKLPFSIYLKDFQLDRYPGSMSPSSYASEVTLIDKQQHIKEPFRIYMNHILEHRGYRFFQASFDRDEKGTVLSVNNDPGTKIAYLGYLLLAIGMYWSLFSKNNRFAQLLKKARKAHDQQMVTALLAISMMFGVTSLKAEELNPSIKTILSFNKQHADKFGELIVQDSSGRMKPLDTLNHEILAKIYRGSSLSIGKYSLDADQVILGMMLKPDIYKNIKMIRTHNKYVNKLIGAKEDAKYVSFAQFFRDGDKMQGYKLADSVNEITRKEVKHRDKIDKAILKVDEKVNICYMVYTGSLIKIWPRPNDVNNKWYATIEAIQTFKKENAMKVRDIGSSYFTNVDRALDSGDWSGANDSLAKIAEYQKFYGASVYPSADRINAEVFYNKAKIFETIYPLYLLVGFVLLILSFAKILKPKFKIEIYSKISLGLLIIFFIFHTIGLALRWYISGHAPWSNGYESMIYIGWATVLAGFIFSRRSPITMAATGILTGLILFVAHLNWMDPQITNLVPVLNSYWLSIHVSMITASYGFIALGALLGFITIFLFIFKNGKNEKQISLSIIELNAINEMSLMVGLVMLTVGNFLGGVWANESWGRYWGWDPKETWALVTILVYAVVVHLRFIKSIYSEFNYAVISLLSFTSVLMTYFGVNYYLSGLHSYAKGDPIPIPDFVPISYVILFLVIILAYRNRKLAS